VSPRGPMEGGGPQTHGMEYESDGKRIFHLISERVKKRGDRGSERESYCGGLRDGNNAGGTGEGVHPVQERRRGHTLSGRIRIKRERQRREPRTTRRRLSWPMREKGDEGEYAKKW
jgi:hypothetical protein